MMEVATHIEYWALLIDLAQQIGRVLRLRKASKKDDGTQNQVKKEPKPVLSEEEAKLWREWPNMSKATTSAALAHVFACEVMQPLLGEDHVDAGVFYLLITYFHLSTALHEEVFSERTLFDLVK